jgi:hypothetical protein
LASVPRSSRGARPGGRYGPEAIVELGEAKALLELPVDGSTRVVNVVETPILMSLPRSYTRAFLDLAIAKRDSRALLASYLLGANRDAVAALPRLARATCALYAPFASFGGADAYHTRPSGRCSA